VAVLAERLRLPGPSRNLIQIFRNKVMFREHCIQLGLPSTRFLGLSGPEDIQLQHFLQSQNYLDRKDSDALPRFPLVLKPSGGNRSREVHAIATAAELLSTLTDASKRAEKIFAPEVRKIGWILEEMIEGPEYDVDGIALDGEVIFSSICYNRPSLMPGFRETGGLYPAPLTDEQEKRIDAFTKRFFSESRTQEGLGFRGVFHLELKLDTHGDVVPIELNPRMGGAEASAAVKAVTGLCLIKAMVYLSLGKDDEVRQMSADALQMVRNAGVVVSSTNFHGQRAGVVTACRVGQDIYNDPCFVGLQLNAVEGEVYDPPIVTESCLGWLAACGPGVTGAEANMKRLQDLIDLKVEPSIEEV